MATNMTTDRTMNIAATIRTHDPEKNPIARGTTAVPITAANQAGLKCSTTAFHPSFVLEPAITELLSEQTERMWNSGDSLPDNSLSGDLHNQLSSWWTSLSG